MPYIRGIAMTFGEKLKALRTKKDMTQSGLATASGVPVGTIRDYEQNKRDPLLSNAQRLAAALGTDCAAFDLKPKRKPKKGKG
jgi:transcriptional regulator with XRE-family HTH domain